MAQSSKRMFENRRGAAEELAPNLDFLQAEDPIVMGLLNGGIILADVIANHLNAPMDVMILEKLSAPNAPQHAVGVVDEHGRISMIESTARWHHLTSQKMVEPARKVFEGIQKRRNSIREIFPEVDVRNRTVILVDEGIATGARMLGAISSVRDRGARKVIVASPAGASKATWQLRDNADIVVIPHRPNKFRGVDRFYRHFPKITHETIMTIIERHLSDRPEQQSPGIRTIQIGVPNRLGLNICCELDLPAKSGPESTPVPAVVFAHGFESNAVSARNVPISRRLAKRGIIGVRLDFTGHGRSEGTHDDATDEQLLDDLHCVFERIVTLSEIDKHRLGLVGSGTGALTTLQMAASEPLLGALVLRGPMIGDERELARQVRAPTLVIHAEGDTALLEGVDILEEHLGATHECMRIPKSNRLFNDPISMELMINASVEWLADHLRHVHHSTPMPSTETFTTPVETERLSNPHEDVS